MTILGHQQGSPITLSPLHTRCAASDLMSQQRLQTGLQRFHNSELFIVYIGGVKHMARRPKVARRRVQRGTWDEFAKC